LDKLSIVYRDPRELTPHPRNANRHPTKQVHQIAESINAFGNINPILIDEKGVVIAGHGRLAAALERKLEQVPTIQIRHLSEARKRALMLADNKIARNSVWDEEMLRLELEEILSVEDEELIDLTGFETPEIDRLLERGALAGSDPDDDPVEPDRTLPANFKIGDLIRCGPHRIICGDAKDPASYSALLDGESADQAVTDPPYNVAIEQVVGLGKTQHREFAEASGEMTNSQFQRFLDLTFAQIKANSRDGAIIMAFMDWRHINQLLQTGNANLFELKNICVWVKTNGGMGSFYRSQHELVAIFKNGSGPHVNNIELGKHGRYRTNVWQYAGANTFRKGRLDDLATHPTVKPVALVADAIKDCSRRNDIILDPFGGSGTTLLAAERTGRQARLIEIDPYYVEATIKRWTKSTGRTPELIGSRTPEPAL